MRPDRFNRGSGCFTCRDCGKKTRDTGDNGDVGLCPKCYNEACLENSHLSGEHNENPEPECPLCMKEQATKDTENDVQEMYSEPVDNRQPMPDGIDIIRERGCRLKQYKKDGMPWNGRTQDEAIKNFIEDVKDWECEKCGDRTLHDGYGKINTNRDDGGDRVRAVICGNGHVLHYPIPRQDGTWA